MWDIDAVWYTSAYWLLIVPLHYDHYVIWTAAEW